jgi:hypothetical protein
MSQIKELRAKLKKLNGLQWTKKQQLKSVIYNNASTQRNIRRNTVMSPEGHPGATYVPWQAAKYLSSQHKSISELMKDLNARKRQINQIESEIFMIKSTVSKDAYFEEHPTQTILGIHAFGFKDADNGFFQEEIWANRYVKDADGFLVMTGGSMRVGGQFEDVVKEMIAEGGIQIDGKFKDRK